MPTNYLSTPVYSQRTCLCVILMRRTSVVHLHRRSWRKANARPSSWMPTQWEVPVHTQWVASVLYSIHKTLSFVFHRSSGSYPYTLKGCCYGHSHVSWQGILHHASRDDQGDSKRKLWDKLQVVLAAKRLHSCHFTLVICNTFLSYSSSFKKWTIVMVMSAS